MKKVRVLCCVMMICCLGIPGNVQAMEKEILLGVGTVTKILYSYEKTATLSYSFLGPGNQEVEEYTIPPQINVDGTRYFVTRVEISATNIKKIHISEGVKEVKVTDTKNVGELYIPSTVTSFEGELNEVRKISISQENENYMSQDNFVCSKNGEYLCSVGVIPEKATVPAGIKGIRAKAFNNSKVTHITCPDSLISVEENAFYNCDKLEKIVFGKKLKTIDAKAFYRTRALEKIKIPKKNKHLRVTKGAIYTKDRKTLLLAGVAPEFFVLPKTTKEIRENAFWGNVSAKTVAIRHKMKMLSRRAFAGSEIENVILPNSMKVIGEQAFYDCNNLEKVKLPSSLRAIGPEAFRDCSIPKLVIPKNVEMIGEGALCNSLEKIVFKGKVPPDIEKQGTTIGIVKVPKKSYNKYKAEFKDKIYYRELVKAK